jgi:transcriptional regulator with XRE-family HTH domain
MPRNQHKLSSIDKHIGERIKVLRMLKKITQAELGKELDVSFQQIQKYESGSNSVKVATLYKISIILKVSILFFYQELPDIKAHEPMLSNENLTLIAAYQHISDQNAQSLIKKLITLLSQTKVKNP